MGRTALRITESQRPLDVLHRAGQARMQWIDNEISQLTTERRELVTALGQANVGNAASPATPQQTTQTRKPMSAAHKAKLREAAIRRKQANAATAPTAPTPVPAKKQQAKTMAAGG